MWKPRNKWQLQTKGGCESSGGGSSELPQVIIVSTGTTITDFNADPKVQKIIDDINSGESGAYDSGWIKVLLTWESLNFPGIEVSLRATALNDSTCISILNEEFVVQTLGELVDVIQSMYQFDYTSFINSHSATAHILANTYSFKPAS